MKNIVIITLTVLVVGLTLVTHKLDSMQLELENEFKKYYNDKQLSIPKQQTVIVYDTITKPIIIPTPISDVIEVCGRSHNFGWLEGHNAAIKECNNNSYLSDQEIIYKSDIATEKYKKHIKRK